MKYNQTNLRKMSVLGEIKGVKVVLIVDMDASRDRRFKLRCVNVVDSRGWDFSDMHTACYEVLNEEKEFEEAFEGFI